MRTCNSHSETLRSLKLKTTPKRLAIIEILERKPVFLSPEEVWREMKKRFARIGLPTVYRNLEELAGRQLITKVVHPDRKLYYFYCATRRHHHHFVCLSCRGVHDIDYCGESIIEGEVMKTLGGKVLSHLIQVNGLCGRCVGKKEIL